MLRFGRSSKFVFYSGIDVSYKLLFKLPLFKTPAGRFPKTISGLYGCGFYILYFYIQHITIVIKLPICIYFWLHKIKIQTMYLWKYPYLHSDACFCIHFYRYYNKPSKSRLVQNELWYENPSLSPSSLIQTLKLV